MGEWIPSYDIEGGMYGRNLAPGGSMTSFIDKCTVGGGDTYIGGQATKDTFPDNPNPEARWEGAYGNTSDLLDAYSEAHVDNENHDFVLMEFQIENPTGAQYYKQTLVVECRVKTQERVIPAPAPEFEGTTLHEMTFYIISIYRREYATPTSVPTITHTFWSGTSGHVFQRLISGPAYYRTVGFVTNRLLLPMGYGTYNNLNYLCFGIYSEEYNEYNGATRYTYSFVGVNTGALQQAFVNFKLDEEDDPNIDPYPDDPDDPGDNPPPRPGDREKEYDPVPIPPTPELTAIGAGFLTLYSPSQTALNLLADEIFSDNILQIIENYFTSISDIIAGLSIVPFFVPVSGFAKHKIGLFESSVSLPLVASQFIEINCGSVAINRYFNNFLDQAPNTKTLLYLPYIGYQELNTDEVMGNSITVKYKCDILSGACVAFVMIGTGGEGYAADRVIAQFSGNVLTQVPTASEAYDSMVSNAINILTSSVGIAAGAAIGGAGGASNMTAQATAGSSQAASAIGAQVGMGMGGVAANTIMAMKPTFSRNGTPGSTAGYMSVQKPYLIKIVPRDAVAPNHIQLKGYPSNYGGPLSGLSGYCEVSEIHLQNVAATVDEITEIYSLLKGGVII